MLFAPKLYLITSICRNQGIFLCLLTFSEDFVSLFESTFQIFESILTFALQKKSVMGIRYGTGFYLDLTVAKKTDAKS